MSTVELITPPPRQVSRSQEIANGYFCEYMRDASVFLDESRWRSFDSRVYQSTLEEQAQYVDYVTKKMYDNHPELIVEFSEKAFTGLGSEKLNSCQAGNMAYILLKLKEHDNVSYGRLLKYYEENMNLYKNQDNMFTNFYGFFVNFILGMQEPHDTD